MSAPLKPHWQQPSHPEIQQVVFSNAGDFSSKSVSRVHVTPFGLFADMSFPPCTLVEESTYATVQISRDRHILLNSDLLYLNHSCEPSLILDTNSMQILAGPRGLQPGDELTFFYPSTEWHMAQPFPCACNTPSCRGLISGAKDMTRQQLAGYWLSGHIRELKSEQEQGQKQQRSNGHSARATVGGSGSGSGSGTTITTTSSSEPPSSSSSSSSSSLLRPPPQHQQSGGLDRKDPTVQALQEALAHAEKVVVAAKSALVSYLDVSPTTEQQGR